MNDQPTPDPLHSPEAEHAALADAIAYLDAYREGTLQFDEERLAIQFIDEPDTGRLIASVPVAAILASHVVLFIPEEGVDVMQLLVTLEEVPESMATDRWMIHHGDPEHVRWAAMWIDSARLGVWVFDGEALTVPNTLAAEQARLCRSINDQPDLLRNACRRLKELEVEEPRCVGVDQRGLYIRGRFGVIRLPFDHEAADADEVTRIITTWA